ncbi:MAG: histidine kinase N-terminal 7TM domain-containing protein [bacterium]
MTASYHYTPYIWPMLIGAALCTVVAVYSWRHRSVPGAVGLAATALFWLLKLLASTLELSAWDFATKAFWFQVKYACLLPGIAASLVFAMGYAGLETWLNRRASALIVSSILLSAPLYFSNSLHHLVWTDLWMGATIQYRSGVLNYFLGGYAIVLSLVTLAVLIGLFIQSPLHRWPVGLILFNISLSRGLWFLDAAGINPIEPLEQSNMSSGIIGLLYALVLFRFRLFNIAPVARDRAMDQMRDGILVLDADNRIVDLNRAAGKLIGVRRSKVMGRDADHVFTVDSDLHRLVRTPAPAQVEALLDDARCYRVHVSPVADRRGYELGRLFLFYDITENRRKQQQLQEHQRMLASLQEREWLARELHDGVGQVMAAAHLQVQSAAELLARGDPAGVKGCLDQLAEIIREGKAHVGDYISGVKSWSANGPFFTGLRRYLARYGQNARLRTELIVPSEMEQESLGDAVETQLQRIIQEALTNIRKHAGAGSAQVMFAADDGHMKITIEDDGRGFEPAELKDREGFGLRAMCGRAATVGARLEVNSSPGRGTRVVLRLPRRRSRHEDAVGG